MGGGGSKSCRERATSSVPACAQPKQIDWLSTYKASNPCTTIDHFNAAPDICLDDTCPLHYTRTSDCTCTKNNILTVDAIRGYTDSDAHIADCCDGTAPRHTCPSKYCRSSGAAGSGSGCATFMQSYCTKKMKNYPIEASSGHKINIDWNSVDYTTDPNLFIFMWQHYPRCACFDHDGQKFDSKRRHVMYRDDSGQQSFVSVDIGQNPPNCWFKQCKDPYIYGQQKNCSTAISVCTQFADITIQDAKMSPVSLSNNCTANTGSIVTEDQSSTTTHQIAETNSEAEKAYQWLKSNQTPLGFGLITFIFLCCCCLLFVIAILMGSENV